MKKVLIKTTIYFACIYAFMTCLNGFEDVNWISNAVVSLIISSGIICWNWFDYDRLGQIPEKDYLESAHEIRLPNHDEYWNKLKGLTECNFVMFKMLENTETTIRFSISQAFGDSIIQLVRNENEIILNISKKGIWKYLPDNARNYKMMVRLEKSLITIV
ncbi:MAG: hypothetical protein ACPGSD_16750 [Flavobacteriales bacterium]